MKPKVYFVNACTKNDKGDIENAVEVAGVNIVTVNPVEI